MPIGIYEKDDIDAIADRIRAYLANDERVKPSEMAQKVVAVYDKGQNIGYYDGYSAGDANGEARGYSEGFKHGKLSMIDESKIIEKSATGTDLVVLDDVSELPHSIAVQLSNGGKEVIVSHGVFDEIIFDDNNDFYSIINTNVITKTDDATYSLTPNPDGAIFGIAVEITNLPLNIGDVLHCSVDNISKKGSSYGWRVQYQDGDYNTVSNTFEHDIAVDKPIRRLMCYCDFGQKGFTYEPVIFRGVRVVREQEVTERYSATADGIVEGIESHSPKMTFTCDNTDIIITYHKSYGMQIEYDRFWKNYQNFGNRTNYNYAFAGVGFNFTNFYPMYDIKPVGYTTHIFYLWEKPKHYGSLTRRLKECGVVLDTSGVTNLSSMFGYTSFTEIPTIDCTGLSTSSASTSVFAYGYDRVKKIEKIIVKEGIEFTNWFTNTNVEEVIFEGVISTDSLNLQWSTRLTHESLMSVINCLKDNRGTDNWNTITLGSDNIAKLTQEELDIMEQKHWEYT